MTVARVGAVLLLTCVDCPYMAIIPLPVARLRFPDGSPCRLPLLKTNNHLGLPIVFQASNFTMPPKRLHWSLRVANALYVPETVVWTFCKGSATVKRLYSQLPGESHPSVTEHKPRRPRIGTWFQIGGTQEHPQEG